jgi:hypothetical protein
MSYIGDLRDKLNGAHWVFLVFSPDRAEKLQAMIDDIAARKQRSLKCEHGYIPAGVLWNGRECNVVSTPVTELDRVALARGLRQYLGYERPNPDSNVFTLGVTAEEDEELDRVGLLGGRHDLEAVVTRAVSYIKEGRLQYQESVLALGPVPLFLVRDYDSPDSFDMVAAPLGDTLAAWDSDPDGTEEDVPFIAAMRRTDLAPGSFFVLAYREWGGRYHWWLEEPDAQGGN